MKNTGLFIVATLASAILIYSCVPPVTFDEPQPENISGEKMIPTAVQGKYRGERDSSLLIIDSRNIIKTYHLETKMSRKDLDSSYTIEGAFMVKKNNANDKIAITTRGDTIYTHVQGIDTIFHISDKGVLKRFKNDYYLNTKYAEDGSEVKKLSAAGNHLIISVISPDKNEDNSNEKDGPASDTVAAGKHNLTKKEFKEFVKDGGFTEEERYIRVKSR